MSEETKKLLLIAVALVAVIAVGYQAFRMTAGETLQPGVQHNYTGPSLKQMEIDSMKGGASGDAPAKGGEDLGAATPNRG